MPIQSNPKHRHRLPHWLRRPLPVNSNFTKTQALLDELALHSVCQSARCPNHWECWSRGTATFMIAGDRCTRACRFCAIDTAKPFALDADEPRRIAEAAARLRLRHIVITAVARDDLKDGGSQHFAKTIAAVRQRNSGIRIEVLVPDFNHKTALIQNVLSARPNIFNHNLETIRRLTPRVRARATYAGSLQVLASAKALAKFPIITKSGLMLGLGECETEVLETMDDLRSVSCDLLTLGQYLQPTSHHLPVREFIAPERFADLRKKALDKGFQHVASGPLVRSSYHAEDFKIPFSQI